VFAWRPQVEPVGVNLYGSLAFLLWRSVYITKQVSFRNRVLILFDWMKAQVFGRDLSQF
jgi:NADH:ubiquinone reductase (non-electrogenic)